MSISESEWEDIPTDPELDALTELGSILVQSILARRPLEKIQALLDAGAPLWYQDEEGTSALHAAAYVEDERLVKVLIDEGAVWNAVDTLQNTAGDIALSLNNQACYDLIRDAGIRSELLLSHLASSSSSSFTTNSLHLRNPHSYSPLTSTAAFLATPLRFTTDQHGQDICMLTIDSEGDEQEVGVMMAWETPIMQETVHKLCADHPNLPEGLNVLNVGFGLGIIDSLFQSLQTAPALHVIIEPHPSVLAHMRARGWYDRPNVRILEGMWQDFLGPEGLKLKLGEDELTFDVVYTDTFSEDYKELHKFFKHIPTLLSPHGRFSFFNGLGATNALFYDTYTHLSSLHLSSLGLSLSWSDVDVDEPSSLSSGENERWGTTREYFSARFYRLPVGVMVKDT